MDPTRGLSADSEQRTGTLPSDCPTCGTPQGPLPPVTSELLGDEPLGRCLHCGTRRTVEVDAEGAVVEAEVYELALVETFRAPSNRYLGHILDGLAAAGYGDRVLDEVRAIAASEP